LSSPRSVAALEASADVHRRAREIQLQAHGHEVCLIVLAYVQPFVKR
jgi:hypothetical protein